MNRNNLLNKINDLYSKGSFAQLIRDVEDAWPTFKDKFDIPEYAECCRLCALAYVKQGNLPQLHLWRSRALSRFILSDCHDGVASLFISFAMGQKDNPKVALAILDEMELLFFHKPTASKPMASHSILRLLHEYKAYIYAFLLNEFDSAIKEYEKALKVPDLEFRGLLKVNLEIALLKYFKAKEDFERIEAINATKQIIEDHLAKGGHSEIEIEKIAKHNLALMMDSVPFDTQKFKFYSTI